MVASCNAVAAVLLLRIAAKVQQSTYENIAEAVGGRTWKIVTQVAIEIIGVMLAYMLSRT